MPKIEAKVHTALSVIPRWPGQVSFCKWRHLLEILWSIKLDVSGVRVMLTRMQHAMR